MWRGGALRLSFVPIATAALSAAACLAWFWFPRQLYGSPIGIILLLTKSRPHARSPNTAEIKKTLRTQSVMTHSSVPAEHCSGKLDKAIQIYIFYCVRNSSDIFAKICQCQLKAPKGKVMMKQYYFWHLDLGKSGSCGMYLLFA